MEREVKFRGKRVDNGRWVEGSLILNPENKNPRIGDIYSEYDEGRKVNNWKEYEVIPESVGEYIGLKDKNNKEIYEGDKYQIARNETYEVRYLDKVKSDFTLHAATFILWFNDNLFFPFDKYALAEGEVIGNIYDNKDLL